MKRKDIIRKLEKLGFVLKEGGKHTKIYKDNVWVSTLSRQNEIDDNVVLSIEKQTGQKLLWVKGEATLVLRRTIYG